MAKTAARAKATQKPERRPARAIEDTGTAAPFRGFSPEVTRFFSELAANNTRDWFTANKELYETQVRAPLGALVEAMSFAFAAHDIPLTGTAKGSLFRIHRDTRFAKDKKPYKTNAGAVLTRDGTKRSKGLFYIHLGAPGEAFGAIGFYALEPEDMTLLRQSIARSPERWLKIEEGLKKAGLTMMREDSLVRMPKGFESEAQSPVADALRLRHSIVRRPVPDSRLGHPDLVKDLLGLARAGLPLLEYGWAKLR